MEEYKGNLEEMRKAVCANVDSLTSELLNMYKAL